MTEKEWASFGLPPLRLTTADLQTLLETAGPKAELSGDGETPVQASELVPSERSWVAKAVIRTPELTLEFGDDHASLKFDNHTAILADELADSLCPQPSTGLSLLIPLLIGAVLFIALFLVEIRTDVVSLIAMGATLLSMAVVAIRRKPIQPTSAQVEGNADRWRTTFPLKSIGFGDLAQIIEAMGDEATLEFVGDEKEPYVSVRAAGIVVTLRATEGEIVYDDAGSRMEEIYNKVQQHRQTLRWFTHDDLAIIVGMIFPIAAIALAPDAVRDKAVLIAIVPWFAYLLWVLRNQSRKWSVIVREKPGHTQ